MMEQFIKNIRVVKKAIAERKLVVFAGAGVSVDSGVPSWTNLINELRAEIDIPENETDFLRVSQMYYNERQQKEFVDKIRDVLKHRQVRYNDIHEAIFELNPEHIVTTNFDDLFEQVIKAKAYPVSVIKKDSEFPYGRNTNLLIKMHGDLDEANFVIKEDDYLEYSKSHPLIESFIKGIFANKVVLFIGYSFSDINLKIILQSVRNILGHNFQNAYMLSTETNLHAAKRQYLKNKGINIINYNDADISPSGNLVEQYLLMGNNALNHQFIKKNNSLSPIGRSLLYLIKFITKYIDFAESIKKYDLVTQIHLSLDRFNEVRVLPPAFLSNLYPFNNQKRHIYNYNNYTISSNNSKVTNLFFEELDNKTGKIKEAYFSNHSIPIKRKNELENHIKRILEKLNLSSIFYFGRSSNKIELFEYPKEVEEKIQISLETNACECLGCLFNDLRIKDFLKKLKEEAITETSETQSDLLLAYSNYKAGNIQTSYNQFEEIANKAWRLGKYITYYISKQNIKYLRNMVNWSDERISDESKEKIVQKIDDLDLDKLLFQIPTLDDDEYKLLKIIRDNEIIKETETEINSYHEKIMGVYELYQKGGISTGPNYPYLINQELYKLFFFYTYNYIVKDEYLIFRRVIRKGIEALLISYSIDEDYKEKLKGLDSWTIQLMIHYCDENELYKIIDKHGIKKITLRQDPDLESFQYLNNLIESLYNETNFYKRNIHLDDNISTQTQISFFKNKIRTTIHITFLIFGFIEIPKEQSKTLIRKFLDFLKVENILTTYSDKFINTFLNNLKDQFSFEDFIELISIVSEKYTHYINADFFYIVGYGIGYKYPDQFITDENLIREIINQYLLSKKNHTNIGIMHLWKVTSDNNKLIIKDSLYNHLSSNFDCIKYLNLCHERIIQPKDFFTNYIHQLEESIPKDIKWKNGKPFFQDVTFINFSYLIYKENLLEADIPYIKFDIYPDYWKFYFKPTEFDYSKFDAMWLLLLNYEFVHNKLSQIPQIKSALINYLKANPSEELCKTYVQFYL